MHQKSRAGDNLTHPLQVSDIGHHRSEKDGAGLHDTKDDRNITGGLLLTFAGERILSNQVGQRPKLAAKV